MLLRPYQREALKTLHHDLNTSDSPCLLRAITGAGKTCIVTQLVERYYNTTNRTFLILAHKAELVQQFRDSFAKFTNIPASNIGIACSGMGGKDITKRVTLGTIQTFANIESPHPISLLVIDEAHKISIGCSPISQYDQVIHRLNDLNPNLRILGVTSTDFRSSGYIWGTKHAPSSQVLFERKNYEITYEELKKEGYLVPLKGKVAYHETLARDLEQCNVNGDYVISELENTMTQVRHLDTAVHAIDLYCKPYTKICVFCVGIDHAEKMNDLLGEASTTIHSRLTPVERQLNMQDWVSGKKRFCTSVNVLNEGIDIPALEAIIMLRPTLSAGLYAQVIGRVLRPHPGKKHGFLLDLTLNVENHGTDLDRIKVTIPKSAQKIADKAAELCKLCPQCEKEVHVALRMCDCGFVWPESEYVAAEEIPELKDVSFEKAPPEWKMIENQVKVDHTARKTGKRLGRLILQGEGTAYKPDEYSAWFCFADNYTGNAVDLSRGKWEKISDAPFPTTVDEFLDAEVNQIYKILLDDNGDYPEIIDFEMVPF